MHSSAPSAYTLAYSAVLTIVHLNGKSMSRLSMSQLTVLSDIITWGTVGALVADSRRVAQVNVL
jgi:hypothetical protein